MHLYRTRPKTVEAKQLYASMASALEIRNWLFSYGIEVPPSEYVDSGGAAMSILTPDGPVLARVGDYIVRDAAGNFFPMSQLTFEAQYESVNAEPRSETRERPDAFAVDLHTEVGRLDYARQLFSRFCEDLSHDDSGKARTRLISGIQIALREAGQAGFIEPLIFTQALTK